VAKKPPYLFHEKQALLQINVLAVRYLEAPTSRKEEQMLSLMESNLKKRCGRMKNSYPSASFDDMMQIARLAVVHALRNFDAAESSFSTWSSRQLWGDLTNWFVTPEASTKMIHIPSQSKYKPDVEYVYLSLDDLAERMSCRDANEYRRETEGEFYPMF
jgi:hypothetical protein